LLFDGKRCTGIAFRQKGVDRQATARREVIVSGGSVNSPHLLQVSGIGPAAHLHSIGVDVRQDSPGVGGNLSDHYVARIAHRVRDTVSINQLSRGMRLLREIGKFALMGNGALTFGVTSAQVFSRSREGLSSPDLQLLFTPASYQQGVIGTLEKEAGMTVAVCAVRPSSRGTIMAASADPLERPLIRPNYLSDPDDMRVILAGMEQARRIFAQPAFAPYNVAETLPGSGVKSEADLHAYVREQGSIIYHPVGTCKMGEDPLAVVSPRLAVHGIEGLRVVDASVMPTVTTGNTNAPTIMIAEKASAMIIEDAKNAT
jgi:choline dehydrogenase